MDRRQFLAVSSGGAIAGCVGRLTDPDPITIGFATDGHYNPPDHDEFRGDAAERHDEMIDALDSEGIDLALFGGDNICHPSQGRRSVANTVVEKYYERLDVPFYAAHGNHDAMSDGAWLSAYGHPKNHYTEFGDLGLIVLDTADPDGNQVDVDVSFLAEALEALSDQEHVFVLSHYWFNATYGRRMVGAGQSNIHNEDAVGLLHDRENVRAILHGHNHGDTTGEVYVLDHDGAEKPYVAGRVFGGWIGAYAAPEGYWTITVEPEGPIEASFETLADGEGRTRRTLYD